jgi:predicted ATPase/signal transduction histidine kinase
MLHLPGYQFTDTLYDRGASRVYRALDIDNDRTVIIRTCDKESITRSEYSRLAFTHEVLNLIDHPGVVTELAWETLDQGASSVSLPFLIMEDIHGVNLWQFAESFRHRQLPVMTFLKIAVQLADALSVIHHKQVVHKDLHPGNIVVNPESLKTQVIDFGLSSLLSREQPAMAAPENLEGVLAYLSPEQTGRMNRALDYRTDFYTLGVGFYQLLTGQLPFTAKDPLGMVYAHMAITQTPACEIREELPEQLSLIIDKLLSKNAEDRYQSALGLKHDLQTCLNSLKQSGMIRRFNLAEQDLSDRFTIAQTLYGRQREVDILINHFQLAAKGLPQLLAVAGYSGIGKSALVHEIHKPIAESNGLFISGKFDQFQQNTPYFGLKLAMESWLNLVLQLPEDQLKQLRSELFDALGSNVSVMTEFIPELEVITGPTEPLIELGPKENQARLHSVFQRFIRLVTKNQPWVIFIDDVQWADRGTLNLLPELFKDTSCQLLLILAYRDNEVYPTHPMMTVKAVEQIASSGCVSTIHLRALTEKDIQTMLMDAIHLPLESVTPLAALVHKKAGGNPFFTIEFLKTLYSQGLLDFNLEQRCWQWDIKAIEAESITDNVVDLMLQKMERLPEKTQELMQLAACVGSQFDLETLSIVSQRSMSDVAKELWPALEDGLLLQEGGDWFLGMTENAERFYGEENESKPSSVSEVIQIRSNHISSSQTHSRILKSRTSVSHFSYQSTSYQNKSYQSKVDGYWIPRCKFLHDRMLQAAYESLDDERRKLTHLHIGRLLYKHTTEQQQLDQVFTITEQLNHGLEWITEPEEKKALAFLNWKAAERSKKSSVWQASLDYACVALQLLPENAWESEYFVTLDLNKIVAECHYLLGDLEATNDIYEELLSHVTSQFERAGIYANRLVQSIGNGQWHDGIKYGRKGLECLGLHTEENPEKIQTLNTELESVLFKRRFNAPEMHPSKLPEITSPHMLLALKIYANLGQVASIIGLGDLSRHFSYQGMKMITETGRCELSPLIYTCYSGALSQRNQLTQLADAAKAARLMLSFYPQCQEQANSYNMLAGISWYLIAPYSEVIDLHEIGAEIGRNNGELARSMINQANKIFVKFALGEPFDELLPTCQQVDKEVKQVSTFTIVAKTTVQVINELSKESPNLNALNDAFYGDAVKGFKQSFHYGYVCLYRGLLAFWSEDSERALDEISQSVVLSNGAPNLCYVIEEHFFLALLLIDRLSNLSETQHRALNESYTYVERLKSNYAPNFEHKWALLTAEWRKQEGVSLDVCMPLFELAIESAEKHGFLSMQAIAHERYANYLRTQGLERYAQVHFELAYKAYSSWGCTVKVKFLERTSGCIQAQEALPNYQTSINAIQSSSRMHLDVASVLKSSQAISSELELDGLLRQVMQIIMENAGAQYGALILNTKERPLVEALVDQQSGVSEVFTHQLLWDCEALPIALISLSIRSGQTINLSDASHRGEHTTDRYIRAKQPKSVLSMPIYYREELIGALYLENNLATNAFTNERLDTIQMLLTQAAISFENARLFSEVNELNINLEQKVEQRTQELKETQAQLVEAEKMASLGALVRGVAHEMNTPLGVATTAASVISDLSSELQQTFEQKKLTMGQLTEFLNSLEQTGELLEVNLKRSNELVELFKRVSVDEVTERKARFNLFEHLTILAAQLSPLVHEQGHELTIGCPSDIMIESYQEVINQVITQLVNNALIHAFSDQMSGATKSGTISVLVESSDTGDIQIVVADDGKGIPSDIAEKVFDPFVTTKRGAQGNIGLGDHIVYNLVTQKLGGIVVCDSVEGEGTQFIITLPYVKNRNYMNEIAGKS